MKKKVNFSKKMFPIVLLICGVGIYGQDKGQTTNQGVFYVEKGTEMIVLSDFDNQESGVYENNGEVYFQENFNNDGITTYNVNNGKGLTLFMGDENQDIKGSIPADFYDVVFNNPSNTDANSAFRLYGNISIAGNAEFSDGIVQNDGFGGTILFEEGATYSNVHNTSHVDGSVLKSGSEKFIFPIGDQDLGNKQRYFRYSAISDTKDKSSLFESKYFLQNSNTNYTHSSKEESIVVIDNKEYWSVKKESGNTDAKITLTWDQDTTPSEIISGASTGQISIVSWDETNKEWENLDGFVEEDNGEKGVVTTFAPVNKYSIFTLAKVESKSLKPDDIEIFNVFTPNGDNLNDVFFIKNIEKFQNTVTIYNRWGVEVFKTSNYDNKSNFFDGFSSGRATVKKSNQLPEGTYFYVVEYIYESATVAPKRINKTGYLYIKDSQ